MSSERPKINLVNLIKRLLSAKLRNHPLAAPLLQLANGLNENTTNFSELVPLLFHYGGKPLTIEDGHFTMEPLFNIYRPSQVLMLCSRQVGKSMTMAMLSWMDSLWTPHYNSLIVSPFYEGTRRLSTDYFASLQEQSPLREFFHGKGCVKQVLERTLPNGSRIRFTYANRNADRARGIHAHSLWLDERQLMHEGVKTVLEATMAASDYGKYTVAAGTPLTNANIASQEFKEQSSRSHWMIKCKSCGKENIAALEYDLLGMIGRWHKNIDLDNPGIKCANTKCGYKLFPWEGRFVHLNPAKRNDFLGIHVPMIVLPMHCCHPKKWQDFLNVIMDKRIPDHQKFNEYLGVPYDDGVSLLTEADIDKAPRLGANRLETAIKRLSEYDGRIAVGVDWGGGGMTRESLTKIAVCGLTSTGRIDTIFGLALTNRMPKRAEAQIIYTICKAVNPLIFAHDDASVGDVCEEMLVALGLPQNRIMPMTYVGQTGGLMMAPSKASDTKPKVVWSVDKARSLLHYVEAVKNGKIAFFDKSIQGLGARELLLDLTHLKIEEVKNINFTKSEAIIIGREAGQSDDFAHACNFASLGLWSMFGWPALESKLTFKTVQDLSTYVEALSQYLTPEELEALIGREAEATGA